MKKLIRISSNDSKNIFLIPIPIGEEVTTDGAIVVNPKDGLGHYAINEYPLTIHGAPALYLCKNFAQLSELDETEIAEARAEREGVRLDCELVSLINRIEYA